jgi:hypothetical protein
MNVGNKIVKVIIIILVQTAGQKSDCCRSMFVLILCGHSVSCPAVSQRVKSQSDNGVHGHQHYETVLLQLFQKLIEFFFVPIPILTQCLGEELG